jgi:aldose 1-epimerase
MGEQYTISAGEQRASISSVGATLRSLHSGDRALVDGFGPEEVPPGGHGQALIPWPNRIADGRYAFRGEQRQLELTEPEKHNAIHGLVRWANWSAAAREPHRLLLAHRLHHRPGYPHVLDLAVEYTLDAAAGLTVRMSATNVGATAAPYGHGSHPYLTVGTPRIDECEVRIPGSVWLPSDERGIPGGSKDVAGTPYDFRTARRLGEVKIDYAYGELARDADGRARVTLATPGGTGGGAPGGRAVSLWLDEGFPWVEIFTGDTLPEAKRRTGLGVEPMSCPPNAFATGEGLIVLDPAQTTTATWGIHPA